MGRVGFEPTMKISTDLQSAALNHSAIFPNLGFVVRIRIIGFADEAKRL